MTGQQVEILERAIASRQDARPIIQQALRHFREAKRATIQVMADIRTLQNGEVHILYGYRNFAKWAEDTFEGLQAGNVRQLTRAGAVALELDSRGLIDLRKPEGIGTTGLRDLSVIANNLGVDKMVEIFLIAKGMLEPGKEVVGTTVQAAMHSLMPPVPSNEMPPLDLPLGEEPKRFSDKIEELIERIRDLAWDLPDTRDELSQATIQLQHEMIGADSSEDQQWIEGTR